MADTDNQPILTDDDILAFTQKTRHALAQELLKGGMPKDPKEQRILLMTLADMDATAINKKRLGAQEKTAEADRLAIMAIAKLGAVLGNRNPFEGNENGVDVTALVREVDDTKLPELEVVPGETDVGITSLNYDDFMRNFKK